MIRRTVKRPTYKIKTAAYRRATSSLNKPHYQKNHWFGSTFFSNLLQLATLFASVVTASYIYNLQKSDQASISARTESDQKIRALLEINNALAAQQSLNNIDRLTQCSVLLNILSLAANQKQIINLTSEMAAPCMALDMPLPKSMLDRVRLASKSQDPDIANAARSALRKIEKLSNNQPLALQEVVNRTPSLSALKSVAPENYSESDVEKIISTSTSQVDDVSALVRKALDNPTNNPLRKPIGPLGAGFLPMVYPSITDIIQSAESNKTFNISE